MKKADLGQYFWWKGELVKVQSINEGHRAISFVPVKRKACPHCGNTDHFTIIESSPLFQTNAEPVKTLTD